MHYADYAYVDFDGERFFTVVMLPERDGRFPTVIVRTPYLPDLTARTEEDLAEEYKNAFAAWLERGYAVVYQHCRGQGKSSGAFVPYVHEREDGLALRRWIRTQAFYNGELFLLGGSYSASLHYTTAPFEEDIRGAVLEVQDTDRYRLWYRNGQMRKGHANWHFGLYKAKCGLPKAFDYNAFSQLPLKGLSQRVLGEWAEDFEQMLEAPSPTHDFWKTRYGGAEAKNATDHTHVPLLLTTGYNDYYVGGVFAMWNAMGEDTKKNCALLVSPHNHGDGYSQSQCAFFPKGARAEQFGPSYQIDWFDHIRLGTPLPYEKGVITYYRAFERGWTTDFHASPTEDLVLPLGTKALSFSYDPLDPPAFSEEGSFQKSFENRPDVCTVYTEPATEDLFVKGPMKAELTVSSDCADTSFYISVSLETPQGDYVLRHDITSLCYQLGCYTPGKEVRLSFSFDEYAFLIRKGQRLRVDIASTDGNTYVAHTNQKGPYARQTEAKTAVNTVCLALSRLILPVEK